MKESKKKYMSTRISMDSIIVSNNTYSEVSENITFDNNTNLTKKETQPQKINSSQEVKKAFTAEKVKEKKFMNKETNSNNNLNNIKNEKSKMKNSERYEEKKQLEVEKNTKNVLSNNSYSDFYEYERQKKKNNMNNIYLRHLSKETFQENIEKINNKLSDLLKRVYKSYGESNKKQYFSRLFQMRDINCVFSFMFFSFLIIYFIMSEYIGVLLSLLLLIISIELKFSRSYMTMLNSIVTVIIISIITIASISNIEDETIRSQAIKQDSINQNMHKKLLIFEAITCFAYATILSIYMFSLISVDKYKKQHLWIYHNVINFINLFDICLIFCFGVLGFFFIFSCYGKTIFIITSFLLFFSNVFTYNIRRYSNVSIIILQTILIIINSIIASKFISTSTVSNEARIDESYELHKIYLFYLLFLIFFLVFHLLYIYYVFFSKENTLSKYFSERKVYYSNVHPYIKRNTKNNDICFKHDKYVLSLDDNNQILNVRKKNSRKINIDFKKYIYNDLHLYKHILLKSAIDLKYSPNSFEKHEQLERREINIKMEMYNKAPQSNNQSSNDFIINVNESLSHTLESDNHISDTENNRIFEQKNINKSMYFLFKKITDIQKKKNRSMFKVNYFKNHVFYFTNCKNTNYCTPSLFHSKYTYIIDILMDNYNELIFYLSKKKFFTDLIEFKNTQHDHLNIPIVPYEQANEEYMHSNLCLLEANPFSSYNPEFNALNNKSEFLSLAINESASNIIKDAVSVSKENNSTELKEIYSSEFDKESIVNTDFPEFKNFNKFLSFHSYKKQSFCEYLEDVHISNNCSKSHEPFPFCLLNSNLNYCNSLIRNYKNNNNDCSQIPIYSSKLSFNEYPNNERNNFWYYYPGIISRVYKEWLKCKNLDFKKFNNDFYYLFANSNNLNEFLKSNISNLEKEEDIKLFDINQVLNSNQNVVNKMKGSYSIRCASFLNDDLNSNSLNGIISNFLTDKNANFDSFGFLSSKTLQSFFEDSNIKHFLSSLHKNMEIVNENGSNVSKKVENMVLELGHKIVQTNEFYPNNESGEPVCIDDEKVSNRDKVIENKKNGNNDMDKSIEKGNLNDLLNYAESLIIQNNNNEENIINNSSNLLNMFKIYFEKVNSFEDILSNFIKNLENDNDYVDPIASTNDNENKISSLILMDNIYSDTKKNINDKSVIRDSTNEIKRLTNEENAVFNVSDLETINGDLTEEKNSNNKEIKEKCKDSNTKLEKKVSKQDRLIDTYINENKEESINEISGLHKKFEKGSKLVSKLNNNKKNELSYDSLNKYINNDLENEKTRLNRELLVAMSLSRKYTKDENKLSELGDSKLRNKNSKYDKDSNVETIKKNKSKFAHMKKIDNRNGKQTFEQNFILNNISDLDLNSNAEHSDSSNNCDIHNKLEAEKRINASMNKNTTDKDKVDGGEDNENQINRRLTNGLIEFYDKSQSYVEKLKGKEEESNKTKELNLEMIDMFKKKLRTDSIQRVKKMENAEQEKKEEEQNSQNPQEEKKKMNYVLRDSNMYSLKNNSKNDTTVEKYCIHSNEINYDLNNRSTELYQENDKVGICDSEEEYENSFGYNTECIKLIESKNNLANIFSNDNMNDNYDPKIYEKIKNFKKYLSLKKNNNKEIDSNYFTDMLLIESINKYLEANQKYNINIYNELIFDDSVKQGNFPIESPITVCKATQNDERTSDKLNNVHELNKISEKETDYYSISGKSKLFNDNNKKLNAQLLSKTCDQPVVNFLNTYIFGQKGNLMKSTVLKKKKDAHLKSAPINTNERHWNYSCSSVNNCDKKVKTGVDAESTLSKHNCDNINDSLEKETKIFSNKEKGNFDKLNNFEEYKNAKGDESEIVKSNKKNNDNKTIGFTNCTDGSENFNRNNTYVEYFSELKNKFEININDSEETVIKKPNLNLILSNNNSSHDDPLENKNNINMDSRYTNDNSNLSNNKKRSNAYHSNKNIFNGVYGFKNEESEKSSSTFNDLTGLLIGNDIFYESFVYKSLGEAENLKRIVDKLKRKNENDKEVKEISENRALCINNVNSGASEIRDVNEEESKCKKSGKSDSVKDINEKKGKMTSNDNNIVNQINSFNNIYNENVDNNDGCVDSDGVDNDEKASFKRVNIEERNSQIEISGKIKELYSYCSMRAESIRNDIKNTISSSPVSKNMSNTNKTNNMCVKKINEKLHNEAIYEEEPHIKDTNVEVRNKHEEKNDNKTDRENKFIYNELYKNDKINQPNCKIYNSNRDYYNNKNDLQNETNNENFKISLNGKSLNITSNKINARDSYASHDCNSKKTVSSIICNKEENDDHEFNQTDAFIGNCNQNTKILTYYQTRKSVIKCMNDNEDNNIERQMYSNSEKEINDTPLPSSISNKFLIHRNIYNKKSKDIISTSDNAFFADNDSSIIGKSSIGSENSFSDIFLKGSNLSKLTDNFKTEELNNAYKDACNNLYEQYHLKTEYSSNSNKNGEKDKNDKSQKNNQIISKKKNISKNKVIKRSKSFSDTKITTTTTTMDHLENSDYMHSNSSVKNYKVSNNFLKKNRYNVLSKKKEKREEEVEKKNRYCEKNDKFLDNTGYIQHFNTIISTYSWSPNYSYIKNDYPIKKINTLIDNVSTDGSDVSDTSGFVKRVLYESSSSSKPSNNYENFKKYKKKWKSERNIQNLLKTQKKKHALKRFKSADMIKNAEKKSKETIMDLINEGNIFPSIEIKNKKGLNLLVGNDSSIIESKNIVEQNIQKSQLNDYGNYSNVYTNILNSSVDVHHILLDNNSENFISNPSYNNMNVDDMENLVEKEYDASEKKMKNAYFEINKKINNQKYKKHFVGDSMKISQRSNNNYLYNKKDKSIELNNKRINNNNPLKGSAHKEKSSSNLLPLSINNKKLNKYNIKALDMKSFDSNCELKKGLTNNLYEHNSSSIISINEEKRTTKANNNRDIDSNKDNNNTLAYGSAYINSNFSFESRYNSNVLSKSRESKKIEETTKNIKEKIINNLIHNKEAKGYNRKGLNESKDALNGKSVLNNEVITQNNSKSDINLNNKKNIEQKHNEAEKEKETTRKNVTINQKKLLSVIQNFNNYKKMNDQYKHVDNINASGKDTEKDTKRDAKRGTKKGTKTSTTKNFHSLDNFCNVVNSDEELNGSMFMNISK